MKETVAIFKLIDDCLIEIADGNTEVALNMIMSFQNGEYRSEFSVFSNRLKRINKQYNLGNIDFAEYDKGINQINNGLTGVLKNWKKNPERNPKNKNRSRKIGILAILLLMVIGSILYKELNKVQSKKENNSNTEKCEGPDKAIILAHSGYYESKETVDQERKFSRALKSELIELNKTSIPIESAFKKIGDEIEVDKIFTLNNCLESGVVVYIYTYNKANSDCIVQIFTHNVGLSINKLESGLLVQVKTPPYIEFDIKKNVEVISNYIIPLINLYGGKTVLALDGFLKLESLYNTTLGFDQQKAYVQFNLGNCYAALGLIDEAIIKYETAKAFGYDKYNDIIEVNLKTLKRLKTVKLLDQQEFNKVVLKDGRTWSSENLNVYLDESWCYDNDTANCAKYGRLYTWDAAKIGCEKLGPNWRLPTNEEWLGLAVAYGGYFDWVTQVKEGDPGQSYSSLIMDKKGNFSAQFGGLRYSNGDFFSLGRSGYYWSSTERAKSVAWNYYFSRDAHRLERYGIVDKSVGFSCRCIKD